MFEENEILRNIARDNCCSFIYTGLDDELVSESKKKICKAHPNDVIVNFESKKLNMLETVVDYINDNVEDEETIPYLSSFAQENYLCWLISKKIGVEKYFENETELLTLFVDAVDGNDQAIDILMENRISLLELKKLLTEKKVDVHFFGLEKIDNQKIIEVQKLINTIVAWRGPKYRAHLYTKGDDINTYCIKDNTLLEFRNDYDIIRNKEQKTLNKSL